MFPTLFIFNPSIENNVNFGGGFYRPDIKAVSRYSNQLKNPMQFSVIVPFYNEERYITHCLDALTQQDFDPSQHEIIFVDNGSTDASCEIVKRYPQVKLLHEKKKGSYAARNKGIRASQGEVIVFTDADCVVGRDWLKNINSLLNRCRPDIVLGSHMFNNDRSLILTMLADYENVKIKYILTKPLSKHYCYCFTNNMVVKSDIFKKTGLFSEIERGADTEFIHQYLSSVNVSKVTYLPEMSMKHLEIKNLIDWLKKQFIRGVNNERISSIVHYKMLGIREKIEIFGYLVKQYQYHYLNRLLLFMILSIGNLFYLCGRYKYRIDKLG